MPLEIGKVVDGTVTGITNFGAFIQLPDGDTGLCHISEIADEYVKDVKDYLKESQTVKVKIIEMNGKGKISLSIRKALPQKEKPAEQPKEDFKSRPKKNFQKRDNRNSSEGSRSNGPRSNGPRSNGPRPNGPRPNFNKNKFGANNNSRGKRNEGAGFEDMLNQFMKDSDEKLREMKKNSSNRRSNGYQRKDI